MTSELIMDLVMALGAAVTTGAALRFLRSDAWLLLSGAVFVVVFAAILMLWG